MRNKGVFQNYSRNNSLPFFSNYKLFYLLYSCTEIIHYFNQKIQKANKLCNLISQEILHKDTVIRDITSYRFVVQKRKSHIIMSNSESGHISALVMKNPSEDLVEP